jgi:predicted nucleotidyltransferase
MTPEKLIDQFVSRVTATSAGNLQSLILFGSAADGEFHPEFSDVNLLCVLRDTSFASLTTLAPTVEWWLRQKQPPPLVLTSEELRRSADVFAIELLDMQQRHRVVHGEDLLKDFTVDLKHHRAQVAGDKQMGKGLSPCANRPWMVQTRSCAASVRIAFDATAFLQLLDSREEGGTQTVRSERSLPPLPRSYRASDLGSRYNV